jgi:aspartate kinase
VTSEEAAELTYYGSEVSLIYVPEIHPANYLFNKVIHPLTIEQISRSHITLRLKNVKNPDGSGTIIYPSAPSSNASPSSSRSDSPSDLLVLPGAPAAEDSSRSVFMKANGYHGETQYRRTPTAVTAKDAITVINVCSNGTTKPHAFLGEISQRIGHHGLVIDLISSSQQMVSLAVSTDNSNDFNSSLDEAVSELNEIGIVSVSRHMSIVSVVGHKMRNMVGVAGESLIITCQVIHFS